MIKKITIEHFFSFGKSTEILLNDEVNILIGINGSGKSNFIKAIRLLYEGVAGNGFERLFLQKWGGFAGVGNFGSEGAKEILLRYEFDWDKVLSVSHSDDLGELNQVQLTEKLFYEIRISKIGTRGNYSLSEWLYIEDGDTRTTYFKVKNGQQVEIPPHETHENSIIFLKNVYNFDKEELIFRHLADSNSEIYMLKRAIEQIIIYDFFDTTFESKIRQLSPYYSEKRLLPDGQNLAFLLNYLNGNSISAYDKILEELKGVNPNFKELVFSTPTAGKTLLALKEKKLEQAITVEHISDGTLRFLLLMSIFYNPNRGSVVCLDEPEIGLHPDMIHAISRGIQFAAQNGTQMIVATHSPLLMNGFVLEDLLVIEKDQNNETVVSSKSEDEFEGWEGEFLVGQMWLRGQIGGTRW